MTTQTFTFSATAVKHEQHDGYATTSFSVFGAPNQTGTITVAKPAEIGKALQAWAEATPVPQTVGDAAQPAGANAWSIRVRKPATGRWPQGYKQAAERSHTFVNTVSA